MSGLDDNKLKSLLSKRSKAELVDWIMEQAAGNEDLRRELVSFVAPQADTATLVSGLNEIIKKAWGRTRTRTIDAMVACEGRVFMTSRPRSLCLRDG